jgi:hypothetical protein
VTWSTAANVSTTIGTFVALVGVAGSLLMTLRSERLTRKGQDLEREQAEATAARSEAAAALTEEYTRRVVDALETIASSPPPGQVGTPVTPVPKVKWSLRHHAGDKYLLENVGDLTAEHVVLSAHPTMIFREPDPTDVAPGEAITFLAARSMATKDSTIEVAWSAPSGDEQVWRYPLPPRPTR